MFLVRASMGEIVVQLYGRAEARYGRGSAQGYMIHVKDREEPDTYLIPTISKSMPAILRVWSLWAGNS